MSGAWLLPAYPPWLSWAAQWNSMLPKKKELTGQFCSWYKANRSDSNEQLNMS
jgi:hypothetical protein